MAKTVLRRALGIVTIFLGFALVVWFLNDLVNPSPKFTKYFHSQFQLILPVFMILVGWRWLRFEGPGIEDIPSNFQCDQLRDSVSKARETLPYFIDQVSKNVDGAYIKFPIKTPGGMTEHIWAYVHSFRDGVFNVSLVNEPFDRTQSTTGRHDVSAKEIDDWQVAQPDGRLKGAYSLIALFQYYESQNKRLSPKMRKQKALLIDA
jgi:uncharacterized protein YegJ (DUF2314 family)